MIQIQTRLQKGDMSGGIGELNIHNINQYNESSKLDETNIWLVVVVCGRDGDKKNNII